MTRHFFHKSERLCSKKIIGDLFLSGESFLCYPVKIVYKAIDPAQPHSSMATFSVSKRNFKRAVDRNKLKRQMREAYRLNKESLYQSLSEKNSNIAVMFIFIGKQMEDYQVIEKGMKLALKRISSRVTDPTLG
jgi:ribonuclease P protein component